MFQQFPGRRKVIVATNIAETSVTIDGVTHVVDSGLAKLNHYSPKTFTESLVEVPVSKASCAQRRGRAGRTGPGTCHRLYTKADYDARPMYTLEEIHRTDLSEVVLRMAELGITDFEGFDFISPPGREGIVSAIETLRLLDALDERNDLTEIGRMMCLFPILPKHSRMIVEAVRTYPRVLGEVIIAATFLSVNSPFLLPAGEELEARARSPHLRRPARGLRLVPVDVRSLHRQPQPPGLLRPPLPRPAGDERDREHRGPARGDRGHPGRADHLGRQPGRLPLRRLPRAGAVRLRAQRQGRLPEPDRGEDPHPSGLGHVPRGPAVPRRRRNRADQPDVRPVGLAAAEGAARPHLAPARGKPARRRAVRSRPRRRSAGGISPARSASPRGSSRS